MGRRESAFRDRMGMTDFPVIGPLLLREKVKQLPLIFLPDMAAPCPYVRHNLLGFSIRIEEDEAL